MMTVCDPGDKVGLFSPFYENYSADAILSVTPYYNKPTQEGLYQHYRAIADSTSLPIVVYNVPGRTGVNVDVATLAAAAIKMERHHVHRLVVVASDDRTPIGVVCRPTQREAEEFTHHVIDHVDLAAIGLPWTPDLTPDILVERLWDVARGAYVNLEKAANYAAKNWYEQECRFELPVDHIVTETIQEAAATELLTIGDARIGDRLGVDIGPSTINAYETMLADAKTVVWNGPMGVFEVEAFATGTNAVARAAAAGRGTTIIGGGDSLAAGRKAGIADRITHISTGGGASLEFLGGRTLPGVAALSDK